MADAEADADGGNVVLLDDDLGRRDAVLHVDLLLDGNGAGSATGGSHAGREFARDGGVVAYVDGPGVTERRAGHSWKILE